MYDHCHVQGSPATRAALAGVDARAFGLDVNIRGNRVGAHRAVDLAHCMIYFYKCFHESLTLSDAQDLRNGCTKFVKILDFAAYSITLEFRVTTDGCSAADATL